MKEAEVLEKLKSYKEAILRIKNERDTFRNSYNDLKNKTYKTVKPLVEDNIEVKEEEIANLRKDIVNLESMLNDDEYLISKITSKGKYKVVSTDAVTSSDFLDELDKELNDISKILDWRN